MVLCSLVAMYSLIVIPPKAIALVNAEVEKTKTTREKPKLLAPMKICQLKEP